MFDWERHFRGMKPATAGGRHHRHVAEFGGILPNSLNADDLFAINDYFHRTPPANAAASKLVSDWATWWTSTGDPSNYWLSTPDSVVDEARNRRLAFDVANAPTAQAAAGIIASEKNAMSAEAMRGVPERRDPTTGGYFVPPKPVLPAWTGPVVVGAVAVGLGIAAIPTLRKIISPV